MVLPREGLLLLWASGNMFKNCLIKRGGPLVRLGALEYANKVSILNKHAFDASSDFMVLQLSHRDVVWQPLKRPHLGRVARLPMLPTQ